MAKYIDKSAVVAEIEKMLQNEYPCDNLEQGTGYSCALYELQDFLNTLEVKEIEEPIKDLEEEIDKELDENWYGEYIDLDKFRESANHFYELGLKAKKNKL